MRLTLFPFQERAVNALRDTVSEAQMEYQHNHRPQVISYTAPTGAGKTIIMSALMENIFNETAFYSAQPDTVFLWLSDSPELNRQSMDKIDRKADKIALNQCVFIDDASFDQEEFDDGRIYFLNTQKLGKSSNLTKRSDSRQYTIWETIRNTVYDKGDRLILIIDEAHRGMTGKDAAQATTIMQKFIKGDSVNKIKPMPLVIGMSATPKRFNVLVTNAATSTIRRVVTTADEVRSSGLLKDKIYADYPSSQNNDMAMLQAAMDEWRSKCEHWKQYCTDQHYAQVNPIFILQVRNGTHGNISDTDLDECLQIMENRLGYQFTEGEVVQAFGDHSEALTINGLKVPHINASEIEDNKDIKVVIFKDSLSTGWDCPRAETMMSMRGAQDETYIAQLLGRMIRTPLQCRVKVDDTLNNVHLFLPYFNKETVSEIVKSINDNEGSELAAEIESEDVSDVNETWTVHGTHQTDSVSYTSDKTNASETAAVKDSNAISNQLPDQAATRQASNNSSAPITSTNTGESETLDKNDDNSAEQKSMPSETLVNTPENASNPAQDHNKSAANETTDHELGGLFAGIEETHTKPKPAADPQPSYTPLFDGNAIRDAVNDMCLPTYEVKNFSNPSSNYLTAMFRLAHFLDRSMLYQNAISDIDTDIADMIHAYVDQLKADGKYDDLRKKAMEFDLNSQVFDVYGNSLDNEVHTAKLVTDTDLDRQLRRAEAILGNDGISYWYGNKYHNPADPSAFKVDVILFSASPTCRMKLANYAEKKFHELADTYRRKTAKLDEKAQKDYNLIVSNADNISKHNFVLPASLRPYNETGGKVYKDHLFCNDKGEARINLNPWEEATLAEEEKRPDFVCWIRNPSRGKWALCLPYVKNDENHGMYPDFLIIRKDDSGYILDILEPHDPSREDNLGKAKGLAKYARENPEVGRVQLIRMSKDPLGKANLRRLDLTLTAVNDKVKKAVSNEELNHIFDTDGFFDEG